MHHRARDITGLRVGYLTATAYRTSDGRKSIWDVTCDCGNVVQMAATELVKQSKRGVVSSCGCKRRETIGKRNTRHGMTKHPAYAVWRSMVDRCRLPTHHAWANYGGRGITVCAEWQERFENFWADMGPTYQPGLTLERVDNEAGYSKQNCAWKTPWTQAGNRRGNVLRESGELVARYADRVGIPRSTAYYRHARGYLT